MHAQTAHLACSISLTRGHGFFLPPTPPSKCSGWNPWTPTSWPPFLTLPAWVPGAAPAPAVAPLAAQALQTTSVRVAVMPRARSGGGAAGTAVWRRGRCSRGRRSLCRRCLASRASNAPPCNKGRLPSCLPASALRDPLQRMLRRQPCPALLPATAVKLKPMSTTLHCTALHQPPGCHCCIHELL